MTFLFFYHLKLRCFVVIDLKAGAFKPEYTGKMNFYLAAVDDFAQAPDRSAEHWPHSLQNEKGACRRVCAPQHDHTNGNRGIPASREASRGSPKAACPQLKK